MRLVSILLDATGLTGCRKRYIEALKTAGCAIVPDFRPLRLWSLETNEQTQPPPDRRGGRAGRIPPAGTAWTIPGTAMGAPTGTGARPMSVWKDRSCKACRRPSSSIRREATGALLGGKDYFPYPPVEIKDLPVQAQVVRSSPLAGNEAMYRVFLQAISSRLAVRS